MFASSCKWIKATESLGRPLCSSQKEWINKKEQILPNDIICWPSLELWSANAPRKTGEIIISNLKSHIDTKGSTAVCVVLLYNIILRALGEISLLVSEVAFCEVVFLKVLSVKDTWYFSWGCYQYTALTELFCLIFGGFFLKKTLVGLWHLQDWESKLFQEQ